MSKGDDEILPTQEDAKRRRRRLWQVMAGSVAIVSGLTMLAPTAHATIADKRNDFNRDGISDVVAINDNDHCLYRWNGTGSGGVTPTATLVGCEWDNYVGNLATPGDLNRDGNGDLVAINDNDRCLYRWNGTGSGGFGAKTLVGCEWDPYEFRLSGAGDLNNDGNGDLVAINGNDLCLYRWNGNGSGGFGAKTLVGCEWDPYEFHLSGTGDLNNDGNGDLVAINENDRCLYRWNGTGSGGFGAKTLVGCEWDPYMGVGALSGMGDLNADGHGDLVAIDLGAECLYRWSGNGSGGFGVKTQLGCGGWSPFFLGV